MKLLNLIPSLAKPTQPTIESYGQSSSGLALEQVQEVMEWLCASLLNAGYFGRSHVLWDSGNEDWRKVILMGLLKNEPILLYRCSDRPSPPPDNCYWRLMGEHPSLRMYQLEVREDK
jgi:hypothetical protein